MLAAVCLGAVAATGAVNEPRGAVGCRSLTNHAYEEIPRLYFDSDADSLVVLLDRWDYLCGPHEVINRSWILGAIWDGAFSEDIYDAGIVDDLMVRGGDLASPPSTWPARARYDSFTVDLADQLLPHTEMGSLQEFFCLFYSGRTAQAWAALDSDSLRTSLVAEARARRLRDLRDRPHWTLALEGGLWVPRSDHSHGFAGNKPVFGVLGGYHKPGYFVRLGVNYRPGRTDRPYWVPYRDKDYLSDRWDVFVVDLEFGLPVVRFGRSRLEAFAAAGGDFLKPLKSADLVLQRGHVALGVGWRQALDEDRKWFAGLDLRFESSVSEVQDPIDLGGDAWSIRLVGGRAFYGAADRKLRSLTR